MHKFWKEFFLNLLGNLIPSESMSKCSYCNKENSGNEMILNTWNGTVREDVAFDYCSEECRKEIERYSNYLNKNVKYFLFLLLLSVVLLILFLIFAMILKEKNLLFLAFGVPIFFFGIIFIKYPFSTPETNQKWGIKKSIAILKKFGWVLSMIGIVFIVTNLLRILS